ncbi:hypothetical protein QBZ16_004769 [Prototheca wickerhamii]|uniref:Uncharacterized protein n=1 Tax=Prototheca wickerhamii TaxID=3111 RepID=A0AAD9IIC7_PROWI|nr:hypothetical protein QBZ16_004769 [Prototheca wickerhamii]
MVGGQGAATSMDAALSSQQLHLARAQRQGRTIPGWVLWALVAAHVGFVVALLVRWYSQRRTAAPMLKRQAPEKLATAVRQLEHDRRGPGTLQPKAAAAHLNELLWELRRMIVRRLLAVYPLQLMGRGSRAHQKYDSSSSVFIAGNLLPDSRDNLIGLPPSSPEFAALGLLCSLLDLLSRTLGLPLLHEAIVQGSSSFVAPHSPPGQALRSLDRIEEVRPFFKLSPAALGASLLGGTVVASVGEGDISVLVDSLDRGIALLERSTACLVAASGVPLGRGEAAPFALLAALCRRLAGEPEDAALARTSVGSPVACAAAEADDGDGQPRPGDSWELIPHIGAVPRGETGPNAVAVLSYQANAAAAAAVAQVSRFREAFKGMWGAYTAEDRGL